MVVFILLLLFWVALGVAMYVQSAKQNQKYIESSVPPGQAKNLVPVPAKKSSLLPSLAVGILLLGVMGIAGYVYLASSGDEATAARGTIILVVLIVVAVLAFAGYFGYLAYSANRDKTNVTAYEDTENYKAALAAQQNYIAKQNAKKAKFTSQGPAKPVFRFGSSPSSLPPPPPPATRPPP